MDDREIILEQYRIYSEAKEHFIDRQFLANRFYLILNLIILVTSYILATLTPQFQPIIVLSVIGLAITLMWWMNIDSYQTLIKVKYANVLEYMETKLPEQPYHKEYEDFGKMKKNPNVIVFGDFQKILAVAVACVYFAICAYNIAHMIKFQIL